MANPRTGNIVTQDSESEHIGPDYTGDNISAKKVANYVFNAASGEWDRVGVAKTGRYDIQGTTVYVGEANVGTSESSLSWTITKFDLSDLTAAYGKVAVDVSWTDRLTGTYL